MRLRDAVFAPALGRAWMTALVIALLEGKSRAAELAYKPARIDNPLKGLIVCDYGAAKDFPHSLRHVLMPLSKLMPEASRFDWTLLDNRLKAIASRGRQAVLRVYLDWPGRLDTIPGFLGDATYVGEANGWRKGECLPDYESPLLRTALKSFVAAFGERYDGHPDIGFVEAGLLGAWGEWLPAGKASPAASAQVQQEILAAYDDAFRTTKVLVRVASPFSLERGFGCHDDWFGKSGSAERASFDPLGSMDPEAWKQEPVGGRILPEIQERLAQISGSLHLQEADFARLRAGHFTYLRLDQSPNAVAAGPRREAALRFARAMGYEFHAASAEISYAPDRRELKVRVAIRNTGIAPFYYRWPVELALARDGELLRIWSVDWDIRSVMPEEHQTEFLFTASDLSVSPGEHRALMRIQNPAPRGLPVSFANETQDADAEGWLTLGPVRMGD